MSSARTVTSIVVHRLTRWGTASVLVGGVLALPRRTRGFGVQTLMWGAIDIALAAVTRGRDQVPRARILRRVLLVNAALDVGYVAAGALLAVRTPTLGGRLRPADARGHGLAVVLQGAALFVIDLSAVRRLRRWRSEGWSRASRGALSRRRFRAHSRRCRAQWNPASSASPP